MRAGVARDIRSVLDSSDLHRAEARLAEIVEKYQNLAPKLASWLEGNLIEGLTVFKLPEHFRRRLRTSNMCERINREIKRRTRVAGRFPNESSVLRLSTAILMDTSTEEKLRDRSPYCHRHGPQRQSAHDHTLIV
jgi:putative transposase